MMDYLLLLFGSGCNWVSALLVSSEGEWIAQELELVALFQGLFGLV